MIDLRHPNLRLRDIRRILNRVRNDIVWDAGTTEESEWVYASIESEAHRQRLLEWLRSKAISDSADAFLFPAPSNDFITLSWQEFISRPEEFFDGQAFNLVSKSLDWILDYSQICVARFGHWLSSSRAA